MNATFLVGLARRLLLAALIALPLALPVAAKSNGTAAVPGEVLVRLRSTSALPSVLAGTTLRVLDQFGSRPIYRLGGAADTKAAIDRLLLDPNVLVAEENYENAAPEASRNAAWAIGQASAYITQWAPAAIALPTAQRYSLGAGTRVAVIDTGVDTTHPLLAGRLDAGYDFVDDDADPSEVGTRSSAAYGHGTHVAGLVALVAPAARIVPVRALDAAGNGNTWVLAEAMLWAVDPDGDPATADGVDVINVSLGTYQRTGIVQTIATLASCAVVTNPVPDDDFTDPGYGEDELRCAAAPGAFVAAAAGNDGTDRVRLYPAAEGAYGLLGVAASAPDRRLAGFSNYGGWIDLAAPGVGLTSSVPGGFGTWSGTSMATPLVSGTAALVRAYAPYLSATDVARRITRATSNLCGGARLRALNAAAAVVGARGTDTACR